MPVSSFPHPIPSGTRLPRWALLDVMFENNWNNNTSFAVGDSLEIPPKTPHPPPLSPFPFPTTFKTPTPFPALHFPTSFPTPTQSSSPNAGAIAGRVVGGVAAIAVPGLAIFFWLRRKRSQAPSAAFVVDGTPQPLMSEVRDDGTHGPSSMPETPASPMKLYGPNDPTTFPEFQGAGQVHTELEVPVTVQREVGNTLANIQTSSPQEYYGFPTV
ncbi:hypothetical protein BJV78DRAFT_1282928 [Lactifluus subvellereus]|nr:hypothetical protein BJV78DRAFT_1282928 [Lactifluus subvellereus]